jgi:cell division protein FtsA
MNGLKGEFNNPMYATGIGLVLYGIESIMPSERGGFSSDLFNRILNKMTGWFKNILGKR